ncbi:MAG: protoporphyrinogen oxidase [Streptosporangiales bacterium]
MTAPGSSQRQHVVVVGGGVAGLAAAWFLGETGRVDVTVLEGANRVGGKLRVSEVAGVPVDEGAESMLARRPEGVALARSVGLGGELVTPGAASAAILAGGALHPIPRGQVMGVPGDLQALRESGLLSADGLARVEAEERLPAEPLVDDVAVGPYVAARMGREVVDRLVEPLLGGVYAGRADGLSLLATLPQLAPGLRREGVLGAAARDARGAGGAQAGPVFQTVRTGMGTLPGVLADRADARVRTGAMVRELRRVDGRWALTVGPTRAPEVVHADAVVLAVPARPASRLLAGVAEQASADLAGIDYASMAIATLAYPSTAFPSPPTGSGLLVSAPEGLLVKAVTFYTTKWPHVPAGDLVIVRCSLGRFGEERRLQADDADLVAVAYEELAAAVGVAAKPVEARLTRWGGALPQYGIGHLDRVDRIRTSVATQPGLAVCGAAYDGVGIPACIATARQAVDRVLGALRAE